jgi:hypothetical protein
MKNPRLSFRHFISAALCIIASFFAVQNTHAMSFNAQPPMLYLGGAVVPSDWDAWQEAMTRYPNEIAR